MEKEKVIIWVPKDTIEIKIMSKQSDGTIEEKIYQKEDIDRNKITPFMEKLP